MLWLLEDLETVTFEALEPLLPRISETRLTRVLSMKQEQARVQSVLGELLLRRALQAEYGLAELPTIQTGKKGKPFFPDHPDVHFNLSHCITAVACALDSAPVGVDVQEIRPLRDKHCLSVPSVYRVLSEKERTWVEAGKTSAEQDRRFTAVWTCKEAYGKALGDGLLYDMKSTSFCPQKHPWPQSGFTFRCIDLENTVLTLCAERSLRLRRVPFTRLQICFSEESI